MEPPTPNKKKIIIIPTYNEKDNIEELIDEIHLIVPEANILVIDDNSPDGTANIVKKLQYNLSNLMLICRPGKLGLGTAYKLGFEYAIKNNYDYIVEMDADFSHDPVHLEQFFSQIEDYDVVIGSRYIAGGRLVNWPISRFLLSRLASIYVKVITGIPIHDTTAGFKCFRREVLESIDLKNIMSDGYSFQIEMHYKAWKKGWRLKEVPITFVDRSQGQSKLNRGIIWEAIWMPIKLRFMPIYDFLKENLRFDLEDIEF